MCNLCHRSNKFVFSSPTHHFNHTITEIRSLYCYFDIDIHLQWAQGSEGFILCYAIDSISSFEQVDTFWRVIKAAHKHHTPPVILVGCKSDLTAERYETSKLTVIINVKVLTFWHRKVSSEDAHKLAEKYKWLHIETSAKHNVNVNQCFELLVTTILNKSAPSPTTTPVPPSTSPSPSPSTPLSSSPSMSPSSLGVLKPKGRLSSDGSSPILAKKNVHKEDLIDWMAQYSSEMLNVCASSLEDTIKSTDKPSVLVVGRVGAGKSSLVNAIFGQTMAHTGCGAPILIPGKFKLYNPEDKPIKIWDSEGNHLHIITFHHPQHYHSDSRT